MDRNPITCLTYSVRCRDIHPTCPVRSESQQRGTRAMREHAPLAAREHRRQPTGMWGEVRMADRVDAVVHPIQPPGGRPSRREPPVDANSPELLGRDQAVLSRRNLRHPSEHESAVRIGSVGDPYLPVGWHGGSVAVRGARVGGRCAAGVAEGARRCGGGARRCGGSVRVPGAGDAGVALRCAGVALRRAQVWRLSRPGGGVARRGGRPIRRRRLPSRSSRRTSVRG
jgi:hypothetical protein